MDNEAYIWEYLRSNGFTEAGAAGLMGNLYAESGFNPQNLQNSYEKKLNMDDVTYTQQVDNGAYTNFIHDKAGYGLAQWTYWSRKEGLLNLAKQKNVSIGDLPMQLDFLMIELARSFPQVLKKLKSTTSIVEASNIVLLEFEKPARKDDPEIQKRRVDFAKKSYNKFAKQTNIEADNIAVTGIMKYSSANKPLQCMMTQSTCYKSTRKMNILGVLWHSTGCNNTNVKRYVQPDDNAPNRQQLLDTIGVNKGKNDWNHANVNAGVNAWIGKIADGTVASVQTMPWNYRPWGCGAGKNGSCNNGWIQFEICEDALNNRDYFDKVYKEACELTAYLCKMYDLDPTGYTTCNGIKCPVILCHADSCKLGLGSNHGDVLHWFPKFGKTMQDIREDVKALISNTPITTNSNPTNINYNINTSYNQNEEDEDMTQEKFDEMMDVWINEQARKLPGDWSKEAREWAERNNFINGNESGNKMYKKFMTREEFATVLYRALHRYFIS